MELIPCRVEEKFPEVCWAESYSLSRLTRLRLSPDRKSFLFILDLMKESNTSPRLLLLYVGATKEHYKHTNTVTRTLRQVRHFSSMCSFMTGISLRSSH